MWAETLRGFEPDDIKWALGALAGSYLDFPPTVYQFRQLCLSGRTVREQRTQRLMPPGIPPDPETAARIREQAREIGRPKRDKRVWARRILERGNRGDPVPAIAVEFAKEALGMVEVAREPGSDDT